MDNEIDEFEEEVENLEKEEEIEEEESEKESKKQKSKGKVETKEEGEAPTERYSAFYQEERIGIVDTVTQEVVIEGLADFTTARLEAMKFNKLDKIETVTGIN